LNIPKPKMNSYKKIAIKDQEFAYDLDPDLVFNFTEDHIQIIYTDSRTNGEITETIYASQFHSKHTV
jgi:hypothetical protein